MYPKRGGTESSNESPHLSHLALWCSEVFSFWLPRVFCRIHTSKFQGMSYWDIINLDPWQRTNKTLHRTVIFFFSHEPRSLLGFSMAWTLNLWLPLKQDLLIIHPLDLFGNKKTPKRLDAKRSLFPSPVFLCWNSWETWYPAMMQSNGGPSHFCSSIQFI